MDEDRCYYHSPITFHVTFFLKLNEEKVEYYALYYKPDREVDIHNSFPVVFQPLLIIVYSYQLN